MIGLREQELRTEIIAMQLELSTGLPPRGADSGWRGRTEQRIQEKKRKLSRLQRRRKRSRTNRHLFH